MDLEEKLRWNRIQIRIKDRLKRELSEAISEVLKEYGITGEYIFNVKRDADYSHEPITCLDGKRLVFSEHLWILGEGCATVEDHSDITSIGYLEAVVKKQEGAKAFSY